MNDKSSPAARRSFLASLAALTAIPFQARASTPGARYTPEGQPIPDLCLVSYLKLGMHTMTAVLRRWSNGAERDCKLCPPGTCSALDGSCLITYGFGIPLNEARLYQIDGEPQRNVGP